MRPLPDLTPLPDSPDTFPASDDFLTAFASDFQSMDSLAAQSSNDQNTVADGVGSVTQSIDSLSTDLDTATSVLDGLSSDLDSVDLTSSMLETQAADTALDAGLSNPALDFTGAINGIISAISNTIMPLLTDLYNLLANAINAVWNFVQQLWWDFMDLLNWFAPL